MLRAATPRYGATLVGVLLNFAIVTIVIMVAVFPLLPIAAGLSRSVFRTFGSMGAGFGIMALLMPGPLLFGQILYPIIALETKSPWLAMHIAYRRVRSAGFRRVWKLGFTLLAFDYVPITVVNLSAVQIGRVVHSWMPVDLTTPLAEGVTAVFSVVIATVISIEMRVRSEGSDIETSIDHAGQVSMENGGASSAGISSAGSE
ncbi:MAG TPA: hypothetical protein VHT05_13320 [Candidatus Elarobacter sp.]|nr:hypothetical protein [Candidatus Elarobacter sp.]